MPRELDTAIANEIHEIWTKMPFYGYRKITAELGRRDIEVNHKKVLRLMKEMGIKAIYPTPRTSMGSPNHKIYPYLLLGLKIVWPNQAWSTDITYIKTPNGFMYLVALIDIYSRYVVGWRLSNTLDTSFCLDMLYDALAKYGASDIINTDQGSQFTSTNWIAAVEVNGIRVSMDGKGCWVDNVYIERLWRTIKYELIYLHSYNTVSELKQAIGDFISFYNEKRLHQSLKYKTPAEIYYDK